MNRSGGLTILVCLIWALGSAPVWGQGQDSTPGERYLRVMAEMLPGHYDNVNQQYFDTRRKRADNDRHERVSTTITRVQAPGFGPYAFLWITRTETSQGPRVSARMATLEAGPGADEVTLRHFFRMEGEIRESELTALQPGDLRRTEGCDYLFVRRADHFVGRQRTKACRFDWDGQAVYTDNEIQLSQTSLWFHDHKWVVANGRRITGTASGEPYWLERSRTFHCYADIPGVGGGAAIPFQRYDDILLHDKGGMHWIEASNGQRIGLNLRAVTWHVLNEKNGDFNRDSMVLSVLERLPEGGIKEHGYAFTDPDVERIALNLKWILVNCAITPRRDARPEL